MLIHKVTTTTPGTDTAAAPPGIHVFIAFDILFSTPTTARRKANVWNPGDFGYGAFQANDTLITVLAEAYFTTPIAKSNHNADEIQTLYEEGDEANFDTHHRTDDLNERRYNKSCKGGTSTTTTCIMEDLLFITSRRPEV